MKTVAHRSSALFSLFALLAAVWWFSSQHTPEPTHASSAGAERENSPHPTATATQHRPFFSPPAWTAATQTERLSLHERSRTKELGIGRIASNALRSVSELRENEVVVFPLEAGRELAARVSRITQTGGRITASGLLAQGAAGSFILSHTQASGVEGHVLDRDQNLAYQLKQNGEHVVLTKLPLGSVVCEGIPKEPNPSPTPAPANAERATAVVPALDSKPNAAGVLYLDFDGEVVTDPYWNGGVTISAAPAVMGGAPINAAQITDVWKRVAEDFMPFNVSVTTIRSRYDNAAVGNRMRCIQTPTTDAATWAGGVAYLKSYRAHFYDTGFSNNIPCWSFNSNNASIMAMTISHELGHTLDLRHDGDSESTYYSGHGTGNLHWGPLMGAPFSASITQWSKGEYPDADNQEDDLLIMKNVLEEANGAGTGYRTDEAGNTPATAVELGILSTISKSGVIHSATDADYYVFRTSGGPLSVTALLANEPNLDPRLEVQTVNLAVLASSPVSATSLTATLSVNVPAGTYYLVVYGGSRAAAGLNYGFSRYGSLGAYQLTGTYVPLPEMPLALTHPPASTVVREGSLITLSGSFLSNSKVVYRWRKDGQLLPGKTSPTLTIKPGNHTHSGTYVLEAENPAGMATSDPAVVEVQYKPIFTQQPPTTTQTLQTAASLTLATAAHGTGALSYQWQKNGVDILDNPSASTASLQLTAVDWFDAGTYTCVATNSIGSTKSLSTKLAVTSAPLFTAAPASVVAVAKNSTFTLKTTTVGNAPIRYQWYKGITAIPGATKSSLTLTKASEASHEGDAYTLRATNAHGPTDSPPISVDVQDPPTVIIIGPTAVNTVAGASATLSVQGSGTATLQYQWYQNNLLLLGETQPDLVFASLHWRHRGTYKCVVTNAVGKATSKNITVNLTSPAVILEPPVSMKIATRGKGTLKVLAGGTPVLKYQWLKDGNPIPGATKSSLILSNASTLTEGSYQVDVYNTLNLMPDRSTAATVEVENSPAIVIQPVTTYGPIGGGASLSVLVSPESAPVLRYQWYKGKLALAGETANTLSFTNLTPAQSGAYHVVISNDVGRVVSKVASLFVQTPPQIVTHPTNRRHYEHDTVTFTVKATGSATLKYAWHHNGQPAISGATGPTLTLKNVPASAVGNYICAVSNNVGTAFSDPALLELDPVPAPTYTTFMPGLSAEGHRVRITGTNLNWTTSVKLGTKPCSFVKVNSGELLITVPAGATTGRLIVTTHGGTFTTPMNLVITTGLTNDDFANARILVGSTVSASGSNTQAGFEPNEPFYWKGKTVWYRWKCPASGSYTLNSNRMTFGHIVEVFSGTTITNLYDRAYTYWYVDSLGQVQWSNTSTWTATVQQEYFFRMDGLAYDDYNPYTGAVNFTISPTPSRTPPNGTAQPAPPAEAPQSTGSLPAASIYVSGSGTFKTTFDTGPRPPAFQWQMVSTNGRPLFSLEFDPESQTITGRDLNGSPVSTGQVYSSPGLYDLELAIDANLSECSVLLNGQPILTTTLPVSQVEQILLKPLRPTSTSLPQIQSTDWHQQEITPE